MLHQVSVGLLLVLAMMLTPVVSLECHSGLNFTVGKIPFYFWTKVQCGKGYNVCMMEEHGVGSREPYSEIAVRFGGCGPGGLLNAAMIPECQWISAKVEMTMKALYAIFRDLDKEFIRIGCDFCTPDIADFFKKYLSRDNDFSEFVEAVYQFLSAVGYDEERFTIAYHLFVNDVLNRDVGAAVRSVTNLLKSLASQNRSSRRISKTLRDYTRQFHHAKEVSVVSLSMIDLVPRLQYPVLEKTIPDVDTSFNDISNSIKLGHGKMSEENFSILLSCMTIIESLITILNAHDRDLVSMAFKEIVVTHMPKPKSSSAYLKEHILDELDSFLKKTKSPCVLNDIKCPQQKFRAHLQFQTLPFEYRKRTSTIQLSQSHRFMQSVGQLLIAYVMALSETSEQSPPSKTVEDHYDTIFPKIKDHMKAVVDIYNDPTKDKLGLRSGTGKLTTGGSNSEAKSCFIKFM